VEAGSGHYTKDETGKGQFLRGNQGNLAGERVVEAKTLSCLGLGLLLGLVEIRFRSKVFSSKCSGSNLYSAVRPVKLKKNIKTVNS